MSASVSEKVDAEPELFTESDSAETRFDYDKGGVPIYVALIWVAFLCCYVLYMLYYGLPDFSAWGAP